MSLVRLLKQRTEERYVGMAFRVDTGVQLHYDLLDANGEHSRRPRTMVLDKFGRKRVLIEYIREGLTPPPECVDDLPHTIRIRSYDNVGITGSLDGMVMCDEAAHGFMTEYDAHCFEYQFRRVIDGTGRALPSKWFVLGFARLMTEEHIFDLTRSDLEWRLPTPQSTKKAAPRRFKWVV